MKLRHIANNVTELEFGTSPAITVLFSYDTPVAACIPGKGWFRTETRHSVTTSRHINQWLDGAKAQEIPQAWFDSLASRQEAVIEVLKDKLQQIERLGREADGTLVDVRAMLGDIARSALSLAEEV